MYLCKKLDDFDFPKSYDKTSKKDVFNFIISSKQSKSLISKKLFSHLFGELYSDFITYDFPNYFKFSQQLYHYLNDDMNFELEKCEICGNKKRFLNFKKGYNKTCSKECGRILSVANYKQTCLEKYGVDNFSKTIEYGEKFRKTCLKKYKTDNPFKNEDIKNKIKQTNLIKYGVENPSANEQIKKKKVNTCLSNFGVYYPSQSTNVQNKYKQTCLEKYGVENYAKCKDATIKVKQTKFERYGDENYVNTDKIKQTKFERYGDENYVNTEKYKQTCLEKYGVENYSQTNEFSSKRRKKYMYDNIHFDSKWEIIVYKYCIKNNINFQYQPKILLTYTYNDVVHKYQPDFLIEDKLYEVKGDHFFENGKMICPFDRTKDGLFEEKYKCMLENNVIILRGTDIKKLKSEI